MLKICQNSPNDILNQWLNEDKNFKSVGEINLSNNKLSSEKVKQN